VKNIWILARMTFREASRRRIVLTGLVLGMCFLVIFSIGFHMIYEAAYQEASATAGETVARVVQTEGVNALLLAGLYAVTFLSIAMGALLGADTLAGEISSGTIQTIVTKPVRRSDVVLGKWLGFAMLLALYSVLMSGGTVLSVLIQSGYTPPGLLAGLSLIYLEALLMMTISLSCSSAMPGLATGGVVFGLYGLAFIGGWIEQFGSILKNPTAVKIGIVTSLIIPSEALWRRASYEMQSPVASALRMSPFGAISIPSALMVVYAILYLAITLAVAINTFQHRDL
jgi:ABC-type transport system involved in multi-copper enzyme maturation permease subunit